MISILLNAFLTHDGQGYVRKLQLEFAGNKGRAQRHSCDCVEIYPGMTRTEIAEALRTAADKIEQCHETRALQN